MRILYVSQYFPPEMGAPSARVHELSREWVRLGHQVTVLTAFAHHPMGIKAPQDRWRLTRREVVDGIDVVRTYVYAAPNKGTLKRMISYASFMLSATTIGRFRIERPDIVIGTSPQLLAAYAGYRLARAWRRPFVYEVRDLWPESLLALEVMTEKALVYRVLRRIARRMYQDAAMVVTVGEGYRRSILDSYKLPPERVKVVANGVDRNLFEPGEVGGTVRSQFQWGSRFVILYAGTHGMAHALHKIIAAAREMADDKDVLFVFVGEGAEKERLKDLATQWQLSNVQFIDEQPRARMPAFYAACDLGLVSLRNTTLFLDVLPSKIFEYLAMKCPVLLVGGGEAARLINDAGAGACVPPEDVRAIAAAIRRLRSNPEELKSMGERGRRYVLEHFDRRVLASRYAELLQNALAVPPPALEHPGLK